MRLHLIPAWKKHSRSTRYPRLEQCKMSVIFLLLWKFRLSLERKEYLRLKKELSHSYLAPKAVFFIMSSQLLHRFTYKHNSNIQINLTEEIKKISTWKMSGFWKRKLGKALDNGKTFHATRLAELISWKWLCYQKLIYIFSAIPIKLHISFLIELEKTTEEFICGY